MNLLVAVVILVLLLWGFFSAVCIIYPFKPVRTRGRAFASLMISMAALLGIGLAIPEPQAGVPQADISAEVSAPAAAAPEPVAENDREEAVAVGTVALAGAAPTEESMKYAAEDFMWFEDTAPYRDQIVVLVNKIERENSNCTKADVTSVAQSSSRSKPGDPVFFVTCDSSSGPFNVWFRPSDADKVFAAVRPIGRHDAANACEAYAKSAATHPSTVDFSRIMDLAYSTYPNGRARVVSSFTARNSFNLELRYRIDCLFEGNQMLEANIFENSG